MSFLRLVAAIVVALLFVDFALAGLYVIALAVMAIL